MGGAFASGLAQGFGQGIVQQQQNKLNKAYRDALIENSKLQTKLLENKLNLAQFDQQVQAQLLRSKGINIPTPPPMQFAQGPAQAQPRNIFQKIFGGPQQTQSQPQAQFVSQPPAAMPMPAGQQQSPQANQAFIEDYMNKKFFDMPPWREKFEAEQQARKGRVKSYVDVGLGYLPMSEDNKVMGPMIPKAVEPHRVTVTGPQGEQYQIEQPKFGMGGGVMPGGSTLTAPPPQTIPKGMPESVKQKVTDLEIFENQLKTLKSMASPEVFGLWANAQAKVADSPVGAFTPANPKVLAFHKLMKSIENKQVHQFGGSNLTSQELMRVLASLPRAWNQQDFNTAVDNLINATKADVQEYYKSYSQSEAQRGLGTKPPALGKGKKQPTAQEAEQMLIERGYRRDPDTGKWVR